MVRIFTKAQLIILEYQPQNGTSWIHEKLRSDGEVQLIYTFFKFKPSHLNIQSDQLRLSSDNDTVYFQLGHLSEEYYLVDKEILGIKYNLLLSKDLPITSRTFLTDNNSHSVFQEIDKFIDEQIIIGGNIENNIPIPEFQRLLKLFPTKTTLFWYGASRITGILKDFFNITIDAQQKLEEHLERKEKLANKICTIPKTANASEILKDYEFEKYQFLIKKLEYMLCHIDEYTEKQWQGLIVDFILLIFPKYIAVIENVKILDYYSTPDDVTNRFIDLALVDVNGNIDIIEIKKPFDSCILYKTPYRDNYCPKKELSGSVMQIEKYLFHLGKEGPAGEKRIQLEQVSRIPTGIELKITNPKGMIILGRDIDFENEQRFDFEIIKRQYSNIIDIMTYDDLLQRLKTIMQKFEVSNEGE